MTSLSQRFTRVVRVRSVEHQVAAADQVAAERRIVELLGVARRLGELRSNLRPRLGLTSGQSMQAMGEMQNRLSQAEAELARPIRQAEANHEQASAARLVARAREDGAGRLRDKAAAGEESAATLREDSNRPFRPMKRRHA
ncbi:MAG TPA: hypothetical protein VFM42_03865 [Sphingomicrobium sp.]|jgi:hypothetical protein|nr:hypothetical protein [Sphingomicrobium sp.]